jgi:hypothetical protein
MPKASAIRHRSGRSTERNPQGESSVAMSTVDAEMRPMPPSIKAGVFLYAFALVASAALIALALRPIRIPELSLPTAAGLPPSALASGVMMATVFAPFAIAVFLLWLLPALLLMKVVFRRRWARTGLAAYTAIFALIGLLDSMFMPTVKSLSLGRELYGSLPLIFEVIAVGLLFVTASNEWFRSAPR